MTKFCVLRNYRNGYVGEYTLVSLWALLFCFSLNVLAQNTSAPVDPNARFSIRATHLLGLEKAKRNCNGTLSIQGNALQFKQSGKPAEKLNIASIHAIFVGEESKQVGGVPMNLGKAAAPFGSGRVVSLFAHKKYDIVTVEYVDSDGGVHGAVFQLANGQGELVRDSLKAQSVSPGSGEDEPTKHSTTEVRDENN